MSIKEEALEFARRVDLPSFLENEMRFVPVNTKRNERFYCSPFRSEKSASLHISYKDGSWIWYDHGSAERNGGDAIALLRCMGYSFIDAVGKLASFEGFRGAVSTGIKAPYVRRKTKRQNHNSVSSFQDNLTKKVEKALFTRKVYARLPQTSLIVEKYFLDRGLQYYPEIGARLFIDFKNSLKFIAFPIPSPLSMRGLELREAISADMELSLDEGKQRKCYGVKTLWVLRRSSEKVLITESIMDALAGEVLFACSDATLIALNGVGQAREIERMLDKSGLNPKEALLVLDNDGPGKEATSLVKRILMSRHVKVSVPALSEKDPLRELLKKEDKNGKVSC